MCTYESAGDVIQEILKLDDEKKVLCCCLLWRSWLRRNKINAENKSMSIGELIGQIRYWASESLQSGRGSVVPETVVRELKWQAPAAHLIKLNVDGAFQSNTYTGGWGFVARDAEGEVRGSGLGRIANVASALQAEAVACGEAVQAAANWGMGRVVVETDSQILVKALQSTELDFAPEGIIFRDLRAFIRLNFISADLHFVPRICNKVAALGSAQMKAGTVWLDYVPEVVNCVLASDSAGSS